MSTDWFRLPPALVAEVHATLGTQPPRSIDDVAGLLERLSWAMPMGNTAKLQAMTDGRTPPGADPVEVAERWLADRRTAWSCWAVSTVVAAILNDAGLAATLAVTRRTDAGSPKVDLHAALEIDDGAHRWIADAYHLLLPVPESGGASARPGVRTAISARGSSWDFEVEWCPWKCDPLTYRRIGGPLDPGDVEALCEISTAFTGVGLAPRWRVMRPDGITTLVADAFDEPATRRTWRALAPAESWREADDIDLAPDWDTALVRTSKGP